MYSGIEIFKNSKIDKTNKEVHTPKIILFHFFLKMKIIKML